MTVLGVTGHQLRTGIDWGWVRQEVRRVVRRVGPYGSLWSCLATGADTIAAEEALSAEMVLKVVIPHDGYEQVFDPDSAVHYCNLLRRSSEAIAIAPEADRQESYLRAGFKVAELSELLIVVWDGRPAAGKGGTADVVDFAKTIGTEIAWLNTETNSVSMLAGEVG